MGIDPGAARLVVALTPSSLLSAILCLRLLGVPRLPGTVLALSTDAAAHSGEGLFRQAVEDVLVLFPWAGVVRFGGTRDLLSYDFPDTQRATRLLQRRIQGNDRRVSRGVVAAAENLLLLPRTSLSGFGGIGEVWLEGDAFPTCRDFWRLLPRATKVYYPHSPDHQSTWLAARNEEQRRRPGAWLARGRARLGALLLHGPPVLPAHPWDVVLTLNEPWPGPAPVVDCTAALTADSLRRVAADLPGPVRDELAGLAGRYDRDTTALLLMGNLGDQYLGAEVATYRDLLRHCQQQFGCRQVVVKAHPRHPPEVVDGILGPLRQALAPLTFHTLDRVDRIPFELVLPFLPARVCVAGWTTAVRVIAQVMGVPVLVGVSRLKPLVYSDPIRRDIFQEFLEEYLPRHAEVF